MNVQTMKQTIATPTLCVTTRTDPTSAFVSVGIREMVKTAQVNIWYIDCKYARIFTAQSYKLFNISAIVVGCSPACGPNANCLQERGGRPVCECSPGFEGNGYVCAGSVLFSVAFPLTAQDYRVVHVIL